MHRASATRATLASVASVSAALDLVDGLCALNAASSLEPILRATVETAVHLAEALGGILLLADSGGTRLIVGASSGTMEAAIAGRSVQLDRSLAQLLVRAHPITVPPGGMVDPRLSPLLDQYCSRAYPVSLVPMCHDGELLAILILEFERPSPPGLTTRGTFALFLEQSTIAISRASASENLCRQVAELSALVALDDNLTHAPDFEQILEQIIERVKQMVDAEMGGLMLYDPKTEELVLQKPAFGASEELIRQYRVPLSAGGNAVNVFLSGRPYMSNDVARDPIILQRFVKLYGGRNVITVPLDVDSRRIGVFHVVNKRRGEFTAQDLRTVSLLTSHLGILIHNARLLENERQTVAKLRELNQIINHQREGLQRTLAIHDELTRMVLDGNGIAAMVATLSRLIGNPVAVEDRFANLIGYYPLDDPGDLDEGRRRTIAEGGTSKDVRDDPAVRAAMARLGRERRPVRLPPVPRLGFNRPRVVAPILVGRETLGYVYVLESRRSLDDLDFMTVERAATAIALQMMTEKAAAEARYKLRGDFVAELLSGNYGPDEVLLARAAYLSIDLTVPRAVLVIDVDDFAGFAGSRRGAEEKIVALKAKLLDVVERACRELIPEAVVSAKSDELIVLAKLPMGGVADRGATLRRLGDSLRGEVRRWLPRVSVSVGIGSDCEGLADYHRSYQEARRALEVIKASGQRDRTLAFGQLGIVGLLFDPTNRDKLLSLARSTLGGLLDYDRRHGTELVETLSQYLLHDCRLEETATALHVHLNTLRYRLQRIGQITSVDLHTLEGKLTLTMAVKVLRTLDRDKLSRRPH